MLCHQGARLFIYIFFSRNDFPVGDSARSNILCALLPISGPSTPPHSYFGRPRKRLRADFLTSPVIAFLDAVQKTPVAKKEKKKKYGDIKKAGGRAIKESQPVLSSKAEYGTAHS